VGDFAEALRQAKIDGRGPGNEEPHAAASVPASPPDPLPLPIPDDEDEEEERACDASLAPWRQEGTAEPQEEEEARPCDASLAPWRQEETPELQDEEEEEERPCDAPLEPWRHASLAPWRQEETAEEPPEEEADQPETLRSKNGFWRGRAILVAESPAVASSFHHFALRVRQELDQRQTSSVLITSPLRGEGKTVTACNLALALASMAPGRRIALLELDLRSPSVGAAMGVMPLVGVEDVLAGNACLASACIRMDEASLDLLPAANPVPDAHELLASTELPALLRDLAKSYETIVCDAPPVLPVPDVPLILPHVGAWVAVARAGLTRRGAFSDMLDLLTEEKLIGSFLNCAPASRHAEHDASDPESDDPTLGIVESPARGSSSD
jgi:Mrp family chromosome partitioning ATPase